MEIAIKIFLIFIMTVSGSIGALFFKRSTTKLGSNKIFKLLLIPDLYIGGISYVFGILANIILLRNMDYTLVYPMTALTYVWTMLISLFFLHEKMNVRKVMAIIFIILGVVIINI